MKRQEVTIRNGENISYYDLGNKEEVIILIHGNYISSVQLLSLGELLSKRFRVIIPDLRGSGNSSYYRKISSIKDHREDLFYLMNSLEIENTVLIGFGFGGAIVMDFAATHKKMVNKLVLINSVPHSGIPRFIKNEKGNQIFGNIYSSQNEFNDDLINDVTFDNLLVSQNKEEAIKYLSDVGFTIDSLNDDYNNNLLKTVFAQKSLIDNLWALANFNLSHEHNFYSPGTNSINNIKIDVLHIWSDESKLTQEYMVLKNFFTLKEKSTYIKYEECGFDIVHDRVETLEEDIRNFIV